MPLLYKVIAVVLGLGFLWGGVSLIIAGQLIAGVALIGLVCVVVYFYVKGENQLTALLAETNRRHGTRFTRENGFGIGFCIFFDPEARKVLITKGKDSRLEDFSFIRSWQLTWVEKNDLRTGSLSYQNVRIELHTNDYQSPLMKFSCFSKAQGDLWNSRLGILFG